jgi:hypothetical protein
MVVFAGMASALLLLIQLGDTMRAAYDALISLMVLSGFIPYLYIFGSAWKGRRRVSAMLGLMVTALAIVSSAVPGREVTNVGLFEVKLAAGTLLMVGFAWLVYRRAARRAASSPCTPSD